ncbi:MAG: EAL domain-containing protein [Alphaproteobacteria bacterium]|nr:EAL domain-containing protein [Alphaproteobacteria bacterium]
MFLLRNLDVVFFGGGVSREDLAKACESILAVFGNYAAQFNNPYGRQSDPFTILDLDTEYDTLLRYAERLAGISVAARGAEGSAPRKALSIEGMAYLKRELKAANISAMLFNQPVYNIADTAKISAVFFEIYVSIQSLEEQLCDNHSVLGDRWLFRSLTEDLDAAVLRTLLQPENIRSQRRFSLNLNVSSVAGEAFGIFNNSLTAEQRSRVVVEIGVGDMFENMRLFKDATKALRRKGYKVCLDGLGVDTVPHVDFEGLECDFAKIFWSNDIKTAETATMTKIAAKIGAAGDTRFIMARCDNADSVRYARSLGIRMAQGRLIDQLVKKQIPV